MDPNETRDFISVRGGGSTMGKTIEYVTCPFCKQEVRTYLWSRCGGGKLCPCGAMLGGRYARRRKSVQK